MQKVKNKLDIILRNLVIAVMGLMVLNVLWQVFSRFILKNPSSFTEELARYSLIWLGLLSAGYATGQKYHIAIDLLSRRLKGRQKYFLEIVIELCVLLFSLTVMVVGGIKLVIINLELNQISAALQVPLGYVYLAIPISGIIMCFYSLFFIAINMKQLKQNIS